MLGQGLNDTDFQVWLAASTLGSPGGNCSSEIGRCPIVCAFSSRSLCMDKLSVCISEEGGSYYHKSPGASEIVDAGLLLPTTSVAAFSDVLASLILGFSSASMKSSTAEPLLNFCWPSNL